MQENCTIQKTTTRFIRTGTSPCIWHRVRFKGGRRLWSAFSWSSSPGALSPLRRCTQAPWNPCGPPTPWGWPAVFRWRINSRHRPAPVRAHPDSLLPVGGSPGSSSSVTVGWMVAPRDTPMSQCQDHYLLWSKAEVGKTLEKGRLSWTTGWAPNP